MLNPSYFICIRAIRVETFERVPQMSNQSGQLCVDWCFCVVCACVQCSLGSIVEPQSARAPSLRAGDAPDQQLLSGVADSAQPALLWPVCQLLQRAAKGWTSCPAGVIHVSRGSSLIQQLNRRKQFWPKYCSILWLPKGVSSLLLLLHLSPLLLSSYVLIWQYPGHFHLV